MRPLLLDPSQLRIDAQRLGALLAAPLDRAAEDAKTTAALFGQDRPFVKDGLYALANGVAWIPVRGVLFNDDYVSPLGGYSGYKGLSQQFAAAMVDDEVRAVLFDIDSPGGEGDGVFDLADEIFAARGAKPVWSIANPLAASAAYAIASAADLVFLPQFGRVGSIGVWTAHVDMSGMLDQMGLAVTLIHAGARKVDGNPWQPLAEPARAAMQDSVDRMRAAFAANVARNRGLSVEAVLATEAAIFEDVTAVAAGLADAVATDHEVGAALLDHLGDPAMAAA